MSENIQLKFVPWKDLVLAPNPRPRDSIKEESIREMALSVLEHGIVQPALARLRGKKVETYAGQRRFLGFELARQMAKEGATVAEGVDLELFPVLLREIDDRQMLEHQWIENLQRVDVHPRDEAVGYAELRDKLGYTLDQISEKLGKARSYVSNRMTLLRVPDLLWTAHDEGRVTISHLEIVGSVPNEQDRLEFGKAVLGGQYGDKALTVKETQEVKNARFAVSLRACGFDKDDETLVPLEIREGVRVMGGACVGCDYLSGPANSLVCCNVACYEAKQNVSWRQVKANAEDCGKRVMDVDQTSTMFDDFGDRLLRGVTKLVDLGDKPRYAELGHYNYADVPTWETLLPRSSEAWGMSITARHPKTRRLHQLLEREEAIRLAIEHDPDVEDLFSGRPDKPKGAGGGAGDIDDDDDLDDDDDDGSDAGGSRPNHQQALQIRSVVVENLFDAQDKALRQKVWPLAAKLALVKMALAAALFDGGEGEVSLLTGCSNDELEECDNYLSPEFAWGLVGPSIEAEMEADDGAWLRWVAKLLMSSAVNGWGYYNNPVTDDYVKGAATAFGVDLAALKEHATGVVLGAEERSDQEELVSCEKCGRKNFTEAGLRQHRCKGPEAPPAPPEPVKHEFHDLTKLEPMEVAKSLLTVPVPVGKPNPHGVYTSGATFKLLNAKKEKAEIRLACDAEGGWYAGYCVSNGQGGESSSGAGKDSRQNSRLAMVGEIMGFFVHRLEAAGASKASLARMRHIDGFVQAGVIGVAVDDVVDAVDQTDGPGDMLLVVESAEEAQEIADERITPVEITEELKVEARALYDQGLGKDRIAKQLGISPNTVGTWQKREWPKRGK